jgi:acyl carrier protein
VEEVQLVVRTVLAQVLDNGTRATDIGTDTDLRDYGLDSLKAVALLLGLEEALRVELRPDVLGAQPCTVRTLSTHLTSLASRSA